MKNANVLVVEDRDNTRALVRFWLERAGHTITHEATTLPEALQAVDAAAIGDLACDVVVLDGSLNGTNTRDGKDAAEVLSRIRDYDLDVKVIGFSAGVPLSEYGLPVDIDADKLACSQLPGVIAEF